MANDRRCSIKAKGGSNGKSADGWNNLFCLPDETTHILYPLRQNFMGVVFPFTPTVSFAPTASWTAQSFSHSNYSFNSWNNSDIGDITVTGVFVATTLEEAKYVLAVSHFFKGSMKGGFGRNDTEKGVPPGVYNFNYLGDYQFKDIPVVVTSAIFNYEPDVDYVPVGINKKYSYVPVKQTITVILRPQYNVEAVTENFSLKDFRSGAFLTDTKGGGFL